MAATLTDVSTKSRQVIRYGIFLVILYIIGRMAFSAAYGVYTSIRPVKTPAPQARFGPLPALPFPQKDNLPQFTYTVETPTGGLPALANQAKVYFMPRSSIFLLSSEAALRKARSLGFDGEPEEITQTIYRFRHASLPSSLEMDIVTGAFSISYNLAQDPAPLASQPPTAQDAVSQARNLLSRASSLPEDLTGEATHEFLRVDSQGLSTAASLSEANLIKVNLVRKDIDELPAKTADPNTSNVWFILSREDRRRFIAAQFHYFSVDEEQASTYPLKSAEAALQELQNGQGFIANPGQNPSGNVTIRRIYLAYFDPGTYTEFYQPIIVFDGDNGFSAYVPAVTSDYYGQKAVATPFPVSTLPPATPATSPEATQQQ